MEWRPPEDLAFFVAEGFEPDIVDVEDDRAVDGRYGYQRRAGLEYLEKSFFTFLDFGYVRVKGDDASIRQFIAADLNPFAAILDNHFRNKITLAEFQYGFIPTQTKHRP